MEQINKLYAIPGNVLGIRNLTTLIFCNLPPLINDSTAKSSSKMQTNCTSL